MHIKPQTQIYFAASVVLLWKSQAEVRGAALPADRGEASSSPFCSPGENLTLHPNIWASAAQLRRYTSSLTENAEMLGVTEMTNGWVKTLHVFFP